MYRAFCLNKRGGDRCPFLLAAQPETSDRRCNICNFFIKSFVTIVRDAVVCSVVLCDGGATAAVYHYSNVYTWYIFSHPPADG